MNVLKQLAAELAAWMQTDHGLLVMGMAAGVVGTAMLCAVIAKLMHVLAALEFRERERAAKANAEWEAANLPAPAAMRNAGDMPLSVGDLAGEAAGENLADDVAKLRAVSLRVGEAAPMEDSSLATFRAIVDAVVEMETDVRKSARGMVSPSVRVRKELLTLRELATKMRQQMLDERKARETAA